MKILITGTSSGIGKGCAEFFLKKGHEVYGFDKNAATIVQPGYTHFCLDIRNKDSYPELPPVDILINNAGTQNGNDIDVNLKGTISITEHYGIHPDIYSIVMIGSASGHTGSEFPEYAASKGGVLAYAKNVAMRVAPYQATCNSLDFGGVMTELNPSGHGGQKTLGTDHGSYPFEAVDDCGRSCGMDLFYLCEKPLLHPVRIFSSTVWKPETATLSGRMKHKNLFCSLF